MLNRRAHVRADAAPSRAIRLVIPRLACPKLTLDHDQRNTFVRHLDRMSMPQLVRREPPPHTRSGGGMVHLLARRGGLSPASSRRSVDRA